MPIKRKPMYYACCSICRTTHSDEQGPLLWDTRQAALDAAIADGWRSAFSLLYCPQCQPTKNKRNAKRLDREL